MRLAFKSMILTAACIIGLSGCGGANQSGTAASAEAKHPAASQKTSANSAYYQVVEQLYVAYFGRPADPNGLVNFSAQLAADGASTDIQQLLQDYKTNSGVKALIDSFGTSTESKNLYGNDDATSFVTAVFENVLGRAPAASGLSFWVDALNNNTVTYGNVALQIMAGALINNTAQGELDATLIDNRIAVATDFTADVTSQNAVSDYTGATAAQTARTMLNGITSSTSSGTFAGTASSTVATIVADTPAVNNVAPIVVDAGADPTNLDSVDEAYATVTICAPSNPSLCQTIDHVLVDTGSYGLRLIYSTLTPSMAAALTAQTSGSTLTECTNFIDGYSWGPVRQINLSIAGEKANGLNMQVIGDPSFNGLVPSTCSKGTPAEDTVDSFGSNGVIGVGLFQQDCGTACVANADDEEYFTCTNSGCSDTGATLAQQVLNPVAAFAGDNNGVIVELPSVPLSGANSVSGSLIFGVGTQSNNTLSGSASIFPMNGYGYFTTIFQGNSAPDSFIDSGSNALYFPNFTNLPTCSDGFYCPNSVVPLSASMVNSTTNVQTPINFMVGYADSVTGAASVDFAAPSGDNNQFDWGLPFFFGRNVYVVMDGDKAGNQTGPFVAF